VSLISPFPFQKNLLEFQPTNRRVQPTSEPTNERMPSVGEGGVDDSTLLFTPNSHCFLRPPVALTLNIFDKLFLYLTFRANFN